MITPNDIMDRIAELVAEKFPGEDIHRELCPQGFTRPCTLIVQDECNCNVGFGPDIVELTPVFTLTTFVQVDEYHHSHLAGMHQRQMALAGLFLPGYLKVGDRAPKVTGLKMAGGYDYDTVTVTFSLTLSRSDFEIIEQRPVMEQLHLRQEATTYG
ncbi:MAG TPA: hypothetical protein IAC25_02440 [Candidatus Enterenecus stercoripullorum]|nr:hypothetical protein [Candidatus Enterenecus stercoripullorum]